MRPTKHPSSPHFHFDSMLAMRHGLFYLAVGPVLPMLCLVLLFLEYDDISSTANLLVFTQIPTGILVVYLFGGIPAFITGYLTSDLIHRRAKRRYIAGAGACIGAMTSAIAGFVITLGDARIAMFVAGCGFVAGGMAGWIIPSLPCASQCRSSNDTTSG